MKQNFEILRERKEKILRDSSYVPKYIRDPSLLPVANTISNCGLLLIQISTLDTKSEISENNNLQWTRETWVLGVTRSFSVKGFHRKTVFSHSKLIEMETVKLIENEYIHDRSGDVPVIYFLFFTFE